MPGRTSAIYPVLLALCVCAFPATAAAAPKPKLSVGDVSITEGNAGGASLAFTAKLSKKAKKAAKFSYATSDGTASSPADYDAASGTAKIAKKKKSATILVTVAGDTLSEGDETFTLTLSKPKNSKLGDASATGTIRNDDAAAQQTSPQPAGADIALTGMREIPAIVRGGYPVNERLTVTNNGPQAADGVAVSGPVPAGFTLDTTWSSPSCSLASSTATCLLGSMPAGASQTLLLAVRPPLATTAQNYSLQLTATASGPADPVPGNASYVDSFSVPSASTTIATSSVSMTRNPTTDPSERKQETPLGDVIADSYRQTYGTDFGYTNGGSLRAPLTCNVSPVGPTYCPNTSGPPFTITRGAIVTTLPFGSA